MARKTDIISLLVTELKKINEGTDTRVLPYAPYTYNSKVDDRVFPQFKFIDQINDFPSITLVVGTETRTHIGGGVRYGNLNVQVRGYVRGENALDLADDLLEDIEYVVNSLGSLNTFCPVDIVESQILSLATDEGLLEPYGVVDVNALIIYEISELPTQFLEVFTPAFTEEFR